MFERKKKERKKERESRSYRINKVFEAIISRVKESKFIIEE